MNEPVSHMLIRSESDADAGGIRRVLVESFGGKTEADLVHTLRNNRTLTVSLVACATDEILGYAAFSPMHAEGRRERGDMLGLGPVAVHPKWQRQGIGSALVQDGLAECRRRAVAAVFVLGEPRFYARFGFVPAYTRGLRCDIDAPREAFQVLVLADVSAISPIASAGLVRYSPEFYALT